MKYTLLAAAVTMLLLLGQATLPADRPEAERLFRRKCFRCHDASLTLRPVPYERIDSLVHAMRRYDPMWIKKGEADTIAEFMKQRFHNSPNQSQHYKE